MGKWSHLRKVYPARDIELKGKEDEYRKLTTEELEVKVSELDAERKALKARLKGNMVDLESAVNVLLKRWEDAGNTDMVKREAIGTLTRADDVYCTIQDINSFKEWAAENGCAHLIKETVNDKSLGSLIKGLLSEGQPLPESVKIFTKSAIRVKSNQSGEEGDED